MDEEQAKIDFFLIYSTFSHDGAVESFEWLCILRYTCFCVAAFTAISHPYNYFYVLLSKTKYQQRKTKRRDKEEE